MSFSALRRSTAVLVTAAPVSALVTVVVGVPRLRAAARGAQVAVLEALLDTGVDVNARNSRGETALHVLAGLRGAGDTQCQGVVLLLACGCDVSVCNVMGDSPMRTSSQQACALLVPGHE